MRVLEAEAADLPLPPEVELVKEATPQCLDGCELLIVLGGDGTLLRGAEFARASGVPMLGVNLGSVGFLAEAERDDLDKVVDRVVTKAYEVEERMTVDVVVHQNGDIVHTDWALNEAAVQKVSAEKLLEVILEIDGRPVTGFGCDGIVCATPTGSTAYAFSARRPRRLARGRGTAHGADQRARVVRQADGDLTELGARGGGAAAHSAGGAVVRRAADGGAAAGGAGGGVRRSDAGAAGSTAPRLVHRPAGGQVRVAGFRVARGAALTLPSGPLPWVTRHRL